MSLHADMVTFRQEHPDLSAEELTDRFYQQTTKAALKPLLVMEFWRLERIEIRAAEVRAVREIATTTTPIRRERAVQHAADMDGLRDLLDRSYRWRGGEARDLRYMTREEHQARIDMLLSHRAGVDRSIQIHRDAISLIDATGVSCLDELESAVLEVAAA